MQPSVCGEKSWGTNLVHRSLARPPFPMQICRPPRAQLHSLDELQEQLSIRMLYPHSLAFRAATLYSCPHDVSVGSSMVSGLSQHSLPEGTTP